MKSSKFEVSVASFLHQRAMSIEGSLIMNKFCVHELEIS